MAEKEMTKEEKEKAIAEQLEKNRQVGLKNLDDGDMWNYAMPQLITSNQYGNLSKVADQMYEQTLSRPPSELVYNTLFLPQLMKKGGAITSPYLQETSYQTLRESFGSIKIEDALKYVGANGEIRDEHKDKYVSMIRDEKGNSLLVDVLMSYKEMDIVGQISGEGKKGAVSILEEIVTKPKENKEIQNKANAA